MTINKNISVLLFALYSIIAIAPYCSQLKVCIDDCHVAFEAVGEECHEDNDIHEEYQNDSGYSIESSDGCKDFLLPSSPEQHIPHSSENEKSKTVKSFSDVHLTSRIEKLKKTEVIYKSILYKSPPPPLKKISVYRL